MVLSPPANPAPTPQRGRRRAAPPPRPKYVRRTLRALAGAFSLLIISATVGIVTFGGSGSSQASNSLLSTPDAESVPPTAVATPTAQASPAAPAAPVATPTAPSVPQKASGRLIAVDVPQRLTPRPTGRIVRWSMEIEDGLGVNASEVASTVQTILVAPRGWQKQDGVSFRFVSAADVKAGKRVDVRVTLASPALTDKLCAPLDTEGQVSCWNGERAVLNAMRWSDGAPSYGTDIATYRIYQVSHEVGHGLGHGHTGCPSKGGPAMVMQQQTYGLNGCVAYPWPVRP